MDIEIPNKEMFLRTFMSSGFINNLTETRSKIMDSK